MPLLLSYMQQDRVKSPSLPSYYDSVWYDQQFPFHLYHAGDQGVHSEPVRLEVSRGRTPKLSPQGIHSYSRLAKVTAARLTQKPRLPWVHLVPSNIHRIPKVNGICTCMWWCMFVLPTVSLWLRILTCCRFHLYRDIWNQQVGYERTVKVISLNLLNDCCSVGGY